MLPSLALARPFTNNRDLLKNITFDKVHTNDHNNELVIDHWNDEYCQDYVYDSEYLPVQECFCDEGNFCAYIDTCHHDFFTLNLYHYNYDDYYKCHDSHYYEYLHIPTNQCDDHAMFHCTDPDNHDDDDDDSGSFGKHSFDHIKLGYYHNDNCNKQTDVETYEVNKCHCPSTPNTNSDTCFLPLYCNDANLGDV